MAINKVMHAALKAISYVDLDIHKTYKLSRNFQTMISKLYTPPKDYEIWDHRVLNGGYQVPVRIFIGKNAEPSKTPQLSRRLDSFIPALIDNCCIFSCFREKSVIFFLGNKARLKIFIAGF